MKRVLFSILVFALAGLHGTHATAQRSRGSNQPARQQGWSKNYQESLATARRLDKPLMIVFRCIP